MAQISESNIVIKLETLSFKENGCGVVDVEVTADEARALFALLKKRFEIYTPLQWPEGVRNPRDPWSQTPIRYTGVDEDKNRSK